MSRIFLSFAAVALLAGFALRPAADEADARALAQQWVETWNAHDAAANVALFADGALFAWPDGGQAVLSDRAAFLEGAVQFHAAAAGARIDGAPTEVRMGDGSAVVFVEGSGVFPGRGEAPVHVLLAMEETPAGWRITAEHTMTLQER